jgi:excinuclease ABC subunit B
LYADRITGSMERAMAETDRRRIKQVTYNTLHGITPQSIKKSISDVLHDVSQADHLTVEIDDTGETTHLVGHNLRAHIDSLIKRMKTAAGDLDFEEAARLRDEVKLEIGANPTSRHVSGVGSGTTKSYLPKGRPKGRSDGGKPGTRTTRGTQRFKHKK